MRANGVLGSVRGQRSLAYLYEIRVPGISADMEVIVAKLFARRLSKDVSCGVWWSMSAQLPLAGARCAAQHHLATASSNSRYFDARTNRPAMGDRRK